MNKVIHFEIPFDNEIRANEFYSKVFGWKMIPMPEMKYTIAHTMEVDANNMPKESGAINGGLYKRDEQSSRAPVIVIDVDSIDEYMMKVQKAGGSIVKGKEKVGTMGLYAQVRDTEGNIIGIWETIKS